MQKLVDKASIMLYNIYIKIKKIFNQKENKMVDPRTFSTDENNGPIYKVITLVVRGSIALHHEMFGWYHHLGAAALAVEQNALDMQDNTFNYALVSRSYEGGYGLNDEEIQWFKWNYIDKKWEMCERPNACDGLMFV